MIKIDIKIKDDIYLIMEEVSYIIKVQLQTPDQSFRTPPNIINVRRHTRSLPRTASCATTAFCRLATSGPYRQTSRRSTPISPTGGNRFVHTGAASGFLPHFPFFDSVVKVDASNGLARSWSTESRKFVGELVMFHGQQGRRWW
jgi:hypothetical protein